MPCQESERLLDLYLAALGDFYDAHKLSLTRWLRHGHDTTKARLTEARHDYWTHFLVCGCDLRELSPTGYRRN